RNDAFVKPCFELLRKKSSYPLISEGRRICQLNLLTLADRGKLFKIIKMLYGLMGLPFSEEAEPMDADPAVLEYFIFSFTADFGEVIQDLIAEEAEYPRYGRQNVSADY
ncbi:hypothetical protein ACTQ4E_14460, partial [Lawsonibacter sp. LCP25S3_G6]|uniref:hypothetical protein n=1 Tax=unclassified Lawsonibacter TaxID=2617946 RepID=UPI003F9E51BE